MQQKHNQSCVKVRSCDYFLKIDIPGDGSWTTAELLNVFFFSISIIDLPHMHAGACSARAATPRSHNRRVIE